MPLYALDDRTPELPAAGRFWIAPDAHVIGRVRLGEDASVWFGSVARGDNELIDLGPRVNIQEGSMLHTDPGFPMTIGADCTIGHHAILHGCTIGANSLIGMGATVLNGARIGANCLVGANALVTEGKEFPDNSLIVGAPAKAIRTLDAQSAERLRQTALHYVRELAALRRRAAAARLRSGVGALAVRGRGRRGHAAERDPGHRVVALALDVDVAGLVPRQDGIGLVVEDVVAAVGADHQHRVAFAELVDHDGHAHGAPRQAALGAGACA